MNVFSPAAAQQPPLPDESPRGCLTGVPLGDVRRLRLPPALDAFGQLRPPLDQTALELSLELAYMTYTLELEPWMRAGWGDISIQVDNRLQSGVTVGESESVGSDRIRGLMNAWKVARARMALKELNPLAQVMGALRQRERSDTIKAVTMIHPVSGGHFVVAIGFMGTGSRFYDWFSNFRFTTQDGFHQGFHQLTEYFEQSADRILFPATAAALGVQRLTLRNVLAEMRAPDSRFTLWMAGHSQGGAVMQVFCHRLLSDWGVLARHMVGYGFASPTVTAGYTGRDPAAYPLYHILNTDDLVPCVGALKHLGLCLEYAAASGIRAAAYGWNDSDAPAREQAQALLAHITDTPTMLETIAAFCETVLEEKTEESLNALMEKRWSIAPLDKAIGFAGEKTKESLRRLVRFTKVAYRSVAGRRMDEAVVLALKQQMRPTVRANTVRGLLGALRDRLYPPHMLCRPHREVGAYGYIVRQGQARLTPFVWQDGTGGQCSRLYAAGAAVFTPRAGVGGVIRRRSARAWVAPRYSARSRGIGARRAQHTPVHRRVVRLHQAALTVPKRRWGIRMRKRKA